VNPRIRTEWLLLVGLGLFLFFYGLGRFGLVGADEPRYAQVAREMLEHHDWVTPRLGGQVWLEKPPLYYWQAMLAYAVFGVSDWAARLPAAVDASLIVLGVFLFLRRLRPGSQFDGAMMVASAAAILGFAHAAATDMPLAAMLTLAMLAWYAWWETGTRWLLIAFYVFLALAALAKGPVAPFLAGAIVILFAVAAHDAQVVLKTLWPPGMVVFFAVALPWYVAVQARNPEFFRVFILEHNLARFGTNLYRHQQPFWFFVPVLLLGLIPWTVFACAAAYEVLRAWWSERPALFESGDALNFFLLLWLIVPVLFFSLSQSKLPGYILPALPAGPLLAAEYVRRHLADDEQPSRWLVALHALVAVAPILPAILIQYLLLRHRIPVGMASIGAIVFTLVAAGALMMVLNEKNGLRMLRSATLVPVVLTVALLMKVGAPALDATLSARPVATALEHLDSRSAPIAVFGVKRETEYGLAFYRNQVIHRYEGAQPLWDEHLLVAPEGKQLDLGKILGDRRVEFLGNYAPQKLEFYRVAEKGK
jgi:4-amino-4-deoxy-L-arabinose transferase-like glycosyltransferase